MDKTSLLDLPDDIFHLIAAYLSPRDFLALCGSCPVLYNDSEIRHSASYWSSVTKDTFRVPNQPAVVQADGRRWRRLYQRMSHETRVYGWGRNDHDCLGREAPEPSVLRPGALWGRRRPQKVLWPTEIHWNHFGMIVDIQCGGWSTTVMSSNGSLYTTGVLDDASGVVQHAEPVSSEPVLLGYPPGYAPPSDRYEASTALRQFSAGRSHVLGLSDSGRVWTWSVAGHAGLHVKFLHIDTSEGASTGARGRVTKVNAGWNKSSAYINGTGIVVWEPSNRAEIDGQADQSSVDGILLFEHWMVPNTGYQRPKSARPGAGPLKPSIDDEQLGEVVNWITLEHFVVFVTDLGKLCASRIPAPDQTTLRSVVVISTDNMTDSTSDGFVLDVSGSFRSFAVFLRHGEVLAASQVYLDYVWDQGSSQYDQSESLGVLRTNTPAPALRKIPSMQGSISVAFGDWHFHALHADGTITSYGHEPDRCGALGLGGAARLPRGRETPETFEALRGVVHDFRNNLLLEQCYTHGRHVWFEPEKRAWLDHHHQQGDAGPREATPRFVALRDPATRADVSEWFEQRLVAWESRAAPPAAPAADDDGLPAYFALSVAAAGWHSCALVLVNEAKAQRVRDSHRVPPARGEGGGEFKAEVVGPSGALGAVTAFARSFLGTPGPSAAAPAEGDWEWHRETLPRLRRRVGPNGEEEVMPGEVPVTEWEDGPPVWKAIENVTPRLWNELTETWS